MTPRYFTGYRWFDIPAIAGIWLARYGWFCGLSDSMNSARLALLLFVVALIGCRPVQEAIKPDFTLKGEVFLVTKGAQNIRLGRQEISVYDGDTITSYFTAKLAEQKAGITKFEGHLKDIERDEPKIRELDEAAQKDLEDRTGRWGEDKARATVKETHDRLQKLLQQKEQITAILADLNSPRFFFRTLPPAFKSVKTDSDGKYEIELPKNKRYMLASTGAYNDETLYWLLPVINKGEDNFGLTLSNDNTAKIEAGKPLL